MSQQQDQASNDLAEYEWKQRRIEEAKQAYLRRMKQEQLKRNFN